MKSLIFFLLTSALLFPTIGSASYQQKKYVLCKLKDYVRTIRVEYSSQEDRCQTIYTKAGKDKIVGSGQYLESCMGFLENIQSNLKGVDWNCREVSSADDTSKPQSLEGQSLEDAEF